MCLPTIQHLRNERNISQLQGKVYRKLKVYEDEYNTCHLSSRNISEAYHCGEVLLGRLNNEMPAFVKKVLDEYWCLDKNEYECLLNDILMGKKISVVGVRVSESFSYVFELGPSYL